MVDIFMPNDTPKTVWGADCLETIRNTPSSNWQSCKEVARQCLHCTGLTALLHSYRIARGFRVDRYLTKDVAATFSANYRNGGWVHSDDQESRSGVGSSLAATEGLLTAINSVAARLKATSIVDVGCGDWNWMQHSAIDCDYLGIDIVPEVIEGNRRHERNGVAFKVCNAIDGPIPKADIALCREVLFHLSFKDALAALRNIRTATEFLIATIDLDIWYNSDIQSGDFRRINLLRKPYCLPSPIGLLPDYRLTPNRYLGIWETSLFTFG